jgi:hypothetical protein
MTWGFKERSTAEKLKALTGPEMAKNAKELEAISSRGLALLTPPHGIPARVGRKCGKAICEVYYIDDDDELVPFENQSGPVSTTIWNMATDKVEGDTFIQTKDILGKPVADWEPCFPDEDSSGSESL